MLPVARAAEVAHAAGFTANQVWTQTLNDGGHPIVDSSPNVADLDGQPSVVVGDRGRVRVRATTFPTARVSPVGRTTPERRSTPPRRWHRSTPTGSTRSTSGSGNVADPYFGRLPGHRPQRGLTSGSSRRPTRGPTPRPIRPLTASLTVGNYAGGYGVEAGSVGQNTYALGAANGAMLEGFPWFSDSVFSTAAVADLYADGNNEIISGGESTAGVAYGQTYTNGGHIKIMSSAGNVGTGNPAGGLICEYNTNQNIGASSAAVGQFLAGGGVGHRHRRRRATTPGHRTPTSSSP